MKSPKAVDFQRDSVLGAMVAHKHALNTLRYGSFRGVVRDDKLVHRTGMDADR
jgi:hypothetical protein